MFCGEHSDYERSRASERPGHAILLAEAMVPGGRVELPTPAFSGPRSTGELPRHRSSEKIVRVLEARYKRLEGREIGNQTRLFPFFRCSTSSIFIHVSIELRSASVAFLPRSFLIFRRIRTPAIHDDTAETIHYYSRSVSRIPRTVPVQVRDEAPHSAIREKLA